MDALGFAAMAGQANMVQDLLAHGADASSCTTTVSTPIFQLLHVLTIYCTSVGNEEARQQNISLATCDYASVVLLIITMHKTTSSSWWL